MECVASYDSVSADLENILIINFKKLHIYVEQTFTPCSKMKAISTSYVTGKTKWDLGAFYKVVSMIFFADVFVGKGRANMRMHVIVIAFRCFHRKQESIRKDDKQATEDIKVVLFVNMLLKIYLSTESQKPDYNA